MRSFPLWRSDFSDVGGPAYGKGLQVASQLQTAGLSRWVPLHAAAVWTFTPYDFRSAMSSGVVIYSDVRSDEFPTDDARAALKELKRIRPFFVGDFYPLMLPTANYGDWCGYQYHREDLKAGFAVFFRRHESPYVTAIASLRSLISDATYEVSISPTFQHEASVRQTGALLAQIEITIANRPASVLLEYRQID